MEPFVYPSTRKKLPGKHGQQDLIAARKHPPAKDLSHYKIDVFPFGTAFAVWSGNCGLGELAVRSIRKRPGRVLPADHSGENHRCRMQCSSGLRGKPCWNDNWTSSPTTSRTSTPPASRPTRRCLRNI